MIYNDGVEIDSIICLASFGADIHQIIIGIIVHIIVILERGRKLRKTNFDQSCAYYMMYNAVYKLMKVDVIRMIIIRNDVFAS